MSQTPDPGFEVTVTHDWMSDLDLRITTHDPQVDVPISRQLHKIGIWDAFMTRIFLDLLRAMPQPVSFYDIGANIGWYALVAAAALRADGRHGNVYAFEPSASNLRAFQSSLSRNGLSDRVEVCAGAVSDRTGTGLLMRENANFGGFRLRSGLNPMDGPVVESEDIAVVALDDWRGQVDASLPSFIKMDIQGSEPLALKGFENGLAACRDLTLMLEWEPDIWSLSAALAPHGSFELYHLDDQNDVVRKVTEAGLLAERAHWARNYFDVFAVRGEAAIARMEDIVARFALGHIRFTSGAMPLVERPHRISRALAQRSQAVFTPGPDAMAAKVVTLTGRLFRVFDAARLDVTATLESGAIVAQQSLQDRDHLRLTLPSDKGPVQLRFVCVDGDAKAKASVSALTLSR